MKDVHIYGNYGAEVGSLGWILQQSPTYKTENFKFNERELGNKFNDPWDNHSHDPNHWSHTWIEIQENHKDLSSLNEIMLAGESPGIWGVSYGAWRVSHWDTPATKLGIISTEKVFKFWWNCYMERIIYNPKESIDMHIHDHKQDDPEYKKYMYELCSDYLKLDAIPFWKLQCVFHWGFGRTVNDGDKTQAYNRAYNDSKGYPADIWVDMFDLDIEKLCSILECEYTPEMQKQYKIYLDYCENTLKL